MILRDFLTKSAAVALVGAVMLSGGAALAQRDPAYAAARASGEVGERMDGYLGLVGPASPELKKLVADINIKRKQVYFEQAQAQQVTAEQYAFSAGCKAIARTVPGEKYQAPDGSWQTRTSEPPLRNPTCQ